MTMKLLMLVIFFAIMVSVGIYARKHATSVDGYVLGGRSVGPWLTAFAYGTSYFSAVVFVGYAGQFGWKYGIAHQYEIWSRIYMDRSWECDYRKFAGMGCTRKTYQGYDTAFEF